MKKQDKRQERALHTRRDLIRSAAVAFEQHGYVQATLADISRQAGVSTGALHFHFENKAAVAAAVEAEACAALRAVIRAAHADRGPALQTLAEASHAMLQLQRRDVVVRAGFQLNCDITRTSAADLRHEWRSCVQQLVEEARAAHALAPDVVPSHAVTTIVAATTGFGILGRESRDWLSRRTLDGFWDLLLPRLTAPPGQPDPPERTGSS